MKKDDWRPPSHDWRLPAKSHWWRRAKRQVTVPRHFLRSYFLAPAFEASTVTVARMRSVPTPYLTSRKLRKSMGVRPTGHGAALGDQDLSAVCVAALSIAPQMYVERSLGGVEDGIDVLLSIP